jgi:hypothetical protein
VVCFKSAVGSWEGGANWILNIIVMIQGADLRRFDKHKQRAALGMCEYLPVMNCTLFCGAQGIEVWMGKHSLPSYAVHKWNCRIVIPDLVNKINYLINYHYYTMYNCDRRKSF